MEPAKVLYAAADPEARRKGELLLFGEGLEVVSSLSKVHALQLIQFQPFDCLVLEASLSSRSCNELASRFRRRNSEGKVIEMLAGDRRHRLMGNPDATAGSYVELVHFFHVKVSPPPARVRWVPPPLPGWRVLQTRAQYAKNTAELISIIDEMNRLLDNYQANHWNIGGESYAAPGTARRRSY